MITCNAPHGVQYIRDRIHAPGALANGSSYVNLMDGDARTVAFTVATRERMSVYRRLGGTRWLLLIAIHPDARAAHGVSGAWWSGCARNGARGIDMASRATHAEGIFPFVRILSNVIVRELQTMAIVLDVWLGVPVIYSTFMQYDELAHHFGPSSTGALSDSQAHQCAHRRDLADDPGRRAAALRSRDSVGSRNDAGEELSRALPGIAGNDGDADDVARARQRGDIVDGCGRADERERGQRIRGRGSRNRRERCADVEAQASRAGDARCARCATGCGAVRAARDHLSRRNTASMHGTRSS